MLKVVNLDVFYGRVQALHAINLEVRKKEITALVGANGAGKSTLMRCISGIIKAKNGMIQLNGQRIEKFRPHEIVSLGLIQVPEGRKLFPNLTVKENLEMGSMHSTAKEKREITMKYVFDLLPRLRERKNQRSGTLSGGEQQMVAFGRALMGLPQVLILDEPSIGLAPLVVRELYKTVETLHSDGGTLFLVEQNLKASLKLSQRGYVIENGKIVLSGRADDLLNDKRTMKAYLGAN